LGQFDKADGFQTMAYRRAFVTRHINGVVYGEEPQLPLPDEIREPPRLQGETIDQAVRRMRFPVNPELKAIAGEGPLATALDQLDRKPFGMILYSIRAGSNGEEVVMYDMRHVRGDESMQQTTPHEAEPAADEYPPPGEDRPERHAQGPTWPAEMPQEVFDMMMRHLSRDDVKNLRLVSTGIENNSPDHLFESVVVPVNVDVYGEVDLTPRIAPEFLTGQYPDPTLSKGRDMLAFPRFGHHIKQFGLSLEFDEGEFCVFFLPA
jgi:hypothetical protein